MRFVFDEIRKRLAQGRLVCPFCGEATLIRSWGDSQLYPPPDEDKIDRGPSGAYGVAASDIPPPIPDPDGDRRVEVYCENGDCKARDFVIADTELAKGWPGGPMLG